MVIYREDVKDIACALNAFKKNEKTIFVVLFVV